MTNTASPTKTTERSISMAEPLWLGVRSTRGAAREDKVRAIPSLKWKLLPSEIQFILPSYCTCSRSAHLLGFSPFLIHLGRASSSDHLWCSTYPLMWSSPAFPLEDFLSDSRKKKNKQNKSKPILIKEPICISPQSFACHLAITPPTIRPPNRSGSVDFPEIQSEWY